MTVDQIIRWAEGHPTLAIGAGVLAVILATLAYFLTRSTGRAVIRATRSLGGAVVRVVRQVKAEDRTEDVLTYIAAGIATGVAMTGMWEFFDAEFPDIPVWLRVLLFAFIEVSVITSAVRARRSMREHKRAGLDGAAVWALTGLSAVLAALEASSPGAVILRLSAPLVAAWLWERGMAVEHQRATGRRRLAWKITPERILAKLRLVDPTDRDASEVAVQRYITRLALRAKRLRMLPDDGSRKYRTAARKLDKAMDQAVEYAGLAGSPERRTALLEQIAALYNTTELARVNLPSPWTVEDVMTLPSADVQESEVMTSALTDVSTPRPLDVQPSGRLEIEPPAPERVPDDADRIMAYLTERRAPSVGHSAPEDDPDDDGPGHGAPTDALSWRDVTRALAPSDPRSVGHAPGHDPRPTPAPVAFIAPVGHDDPDVGHFAPEGDPRMGHSDPGHGSSPVDILGQASGAAWVRSALDHLGLYASAADVAEWLDTRGADVTEDAMRSEIKRARARARTRATQGVGADVVPITSRRK